MPLFFICSGYLYQKYSRVNSVGSWYKNATKKELALGVHYVTFTTAVFFVEKSVLNQCIRPNRLSRRNIVPSSKSTILVFVALFFIFLVTPTFISVKAAAVGLVVALAAKGLIFDCGWSTAFTQYRQFSQTKFGL